MTSQPKWYVHPILIFVISILALGTSLFLYIYWYMEVSVGLRAAMERFNLDRNQVMASETWVVIMVLSILVGVILIGIFIIFVYSQKTLQLYRLQNNFINNFTHELKTPVTSLTLFLQTFVKHELCREDQLRYLGLMLADVGRLSENISRILNLARIESKSYRNEFTQVDLVKRIQRFVTENRHLFPKLDIQICPPPQPLPEIRVNLSLIDMMLMNLIRNAAIYNHAEHAMLHVRFLRKGRRLAISFEDNGIGMEPEECRKVFRKFYQVGKADNMAAKGSGLGLYLVQTIAQIHKWRVTAQSAGPGMGSAFTVILPPTAR